MGLLPLNEAWDRIERLAESSLALANDIAVFSVANVKDATDGYATEFDRRTEYFSESELDDIVGAFRACGFYCDVFLNETDFMQWVMAQGHKRFPRSKILVYNTAQSGRGAGRKSLMPAFCALHGVTTLNANAYAVSLARHKFHVNAILRGVGIPSADAWWYLGEGRWLGDRRPPDGMQVISKSTYESASIGISAASLFEMGSSARALLDQTFSELEQPVVVQQFIEGTEAETPVVVDRELLVLDPTGISIDAKRDLGVEFLHFERVAVDDYGFYAYRDTSPDVVERLRQTAAVTAEALQLEGFCRVDARIDTKGSPFVIDVSTTPHLIPHSTYGFTFQNKGGMARMMAALAGLALGKV